MSQREARAPRVQNEANVKIAAISVGRPRHFRAQRPVAPVAEGHFSPFGLPSLQTSDTSVSFASQLTLSPLPCTTRTDGEAGAAAAASPLSPLSPLSPRSPLSPFSPRSPL